MMAGTNRTFLRGKLFESEAAYLKRCDEALAKKLAAFVKPVMTMPPKKGRNG